MAVGFPDRSRSIIFFAAQSRIFVFVLQFFFNYLIPDHNADVFKPEFSKNGSLSNTFASHLFDGLAKRWDAIYFMHIAEYGYTYENTLVFSPLFPFLSKMLACSVFFPLTYVLSYRNVLHISAVSLNFVAFLFSARSIYKLGCNVFNQEHLAYRAAQLFCVNPASVFFSAAYSESLFSFFTFGGLLKLQEGNYCKASCLFALSTATRSNGTINAGFIFYSFLIHWHRKYSDEKDSIYFMSVKKCVKSTVCGVFTFIFEVLSMLFWIFVSCSLFLSHQTLCYLMYCHDMKSDFRKNIPPDLVVYGKEKDYKMPGYGAVPIWCHNHPPISYSSVQSNHWNVGLFRYYEIKQTPNFILALPMLVICLKLFVSYFKRQPLYCISLGLVPKHIREGRTTRDNKDPEIMYFYQENCFVYVIHLTILTIFGSLFMHIQVVTRMICSSCPIFYWYISDMCMTKEERIAMKLMSGKHQKHKKVKISEINSFDVCALFASKEYKGLEVSDDEITESFGVEENAKPNKGNSSQSISNCNDEYDNDKSVPTDTMRLRKGKVGDKCEDIEHCETNNKDGDNQDKYNLIMEVFNESEVIDWSGGWFNKFTSVYFHLFLFVGVAAFSNFFPWT